MPERCPDHPEPLCDVDAWGAWLDDHPLIDPADENGPVRCEARPCATYGDIPAGVPMVTRSAEADAAQADVPKQCGECETSGRNCAAHREARAVIFDIIRQATSGDRARTLAAWIMDRVVGPLIAERDEFRARLTEAAQVRENTLAELDAAEEREDAAERARDEQRQRAERAEAELRDVHHDLKLITGPGFPTAASAAVEAGRLLAITQQACDEWARLAQDDNGDLWRDRVDQAEAERDHWHRRATGIDGKIAEAVTARADWRERCLNAERERDHLSEADAELRRKILAALDDQGDSDAKA